MSQMEISQVLAQMRALQAQMGQQLPEPAAPAATGITGPSFSQVLGQAINQVSDQQEAATTMARDFEMGTSSASVADVMIQMQKASLGFEAMTQVRNRLVDAYQEIMNMPI